MIFDYDEPHRPMVVDSRLVRRNIVYLSRAHVFDYNVVPASRIGALICAYVCAACSFGCPKTSCMRNVEP